MHAKTDREQPWLRRYGWLFIFAVAIGGLFIPRLGLLLIPVMLTLMVMGFFRGKYWCGHLCPHGSVFDITLPPPRQRRQLPARLRSPLLSGLLLFWFMLALASRLHIAMAHWGVADFWDRLGWVFVLNYLVVTVLGTALALGAARRSWCMICPMGSAQRLLYRLGRSLGVNRSSDARLARRNDAPCRDCRVCDRACPLELEPHRGVVEEEGFAHDLCLRCYQCSHSCPTEVLTWETPRQKGGQG